MRTIIAVVVLFVVFSGEGLLAKPVDFQLQWKEVVGASGYHVEAKEISTGKIQILPAQTSSLAAQLEPGKYEIRVAALNKFKKPGSWSDKKIITLEENVEKQLIDLAKDQPQKQGGEWEWTTLLPGYPQHKAGNTFRGLSYPLVFFGLAVYGNSERTKGNALAENPLNDPTILTFILADQPVLTGIAFRNRRISDKKIYDRHQSNQGIAAGLALLLYGVHFVDVSLSDSVSFRLSGQQEAQSSTFPCCQMMGTNQNPSGTYHRMSDLQTEQTLFFAFDFLL